MACEQDIENKSVNDNSDGNKMASSESNSFLLPVTMLFQFIFTVTGGGMFFAGLIAGIKVGWDMNHENNVGLISIVLTIIGGIFFAIGIAITVFMLILVNKKDKKDNSKQ